MDMELELAIETFAKMRCFWSNQHKTLFHMISFRPPGIYKGDYLVELYTRYDDPADTPPTPNLPDWCFEDNNSESSQQNYEEPASSSK